MERAEQSSMAELCEMHSEWTHFLFLIMFDCFGSELFK